MFPNVKTLRVLFILFCVFFAKQTAYAQDFEVLLSSLAPIQDTTCIGDSLELNIEIRYSGTNPLNAGSGMLRFSIGNGINEPNLVKESEFSWEEIEVSEAGVIVGAHRDTIPVSNEFFETGFVNKVFVNFYSNIEEIYLDNNTATDSTFICQLVDFDTRIIGVSSNQDTICAGDSLTINNYIRYHGQESITIDTFYLNYYVGLEGTNGNIEDITPIYRDTFLDYTFEPEQNVPSSYTHPINSNEFPVGSTTFIYIWHTTTNAYIDIDPTNDVAADSLDITCQFVDFETELEPFDETQDTLCSGEDLIINGGIRYNGSEPITVDTLYLNYYVGQDANEDDVDDLTPLHQDTLINRTFLPGEFVPRSWVYSINGLTLPTGSTGLVLIWPTTTRDYLDTNPDNDVSSDSTNIACQFVDFETELESLSPLQDTICLGDTLNIHASIRYRGDEPITIDTFYLGYYMGSSWDGNMYGQTPIYQDTLYNRTFQPGEEVQRVRPFPVVAPIFVQGSTGFVMIWAKTTERYKDLNLNNNVSVDSLTVACIPSLPLNLISFTGGYVNEQVALDWKVSLWDKGSHFDIESSENGLNFEPIDKVNAIANEQTNTYRYVDHNPYLTTTYYRLKMVDIDGTIEYSPIIVVKKDSQNSLNINHIHVGDNQLNFIYSSTNYTPLTMSLHDMMGRLIYREVISDVQFGFNEHKIDVTGFNSGIYIISLQNENELTSRMFRR